MNDRLDNPVAYLVARQPVGEAESNIIQLGIDACVIGRGADADLQVDRRLNSISRTHARIAHAEGYHHIQDLGSRLGTRVGDRQLTSGDEIRLEHGDCIRLGGVEYQYLRTQVQSDPDSELQQAVLRLIHELSSLDIHVVVEKSLLLVKMISGVEESYLITTRDHWQWPRGADDSIVKDLGTLMDDPDLGVSRSIIAEALRSGEKAYQFVTDYERADVSRSMHYLDLMRVWVRPISGVDGIPMAAIYLQSRGPGDPFPQETEDLLDAVVIQVGIALRNAWMHREVSSLNVHLEERVADRTRELEESRERLISQDRLVTLGRLIAGVAHELNNPSAAIASLAETQCSLLQPLMSMRSDIQDAIENDGDLEEVDSLLSSILSAAAEVSPDTMTRRKREAEISAMLEEAGAEAVSKLARILARTGLSMTRIQQMAGLLAKYQHVLAPAINTVHTFARSTLTMQTASRNIARIVDGLKRYSHLDRAEMATADIHQGIQTTLDVLRSRVPEGVEIATRFGNIPPFAHRPGELIQVWTNLVNNALDALGDKGVISIETRIDGDHVMVQVADNGPGIPDEIQERIFDLEFTTHGPGSGLGLGLPICRSIVENNHKGRIEFASKPGHTVFTVYLPLK